MDENKFDVVIYGDDFWNTLGVIRSLGEKGIHPYFINLCKEKSWVKHSKYIYKYWQVSSFEDGYQILMNEIPIYNKAVLLCTSDKITEQLDARYDVISAKFKMSNAAKLQGRIKALMNKNEMLRIADTVHLLHPLTISFNLGDEATITDSLCSIKYPCITKPIASFKGAKEDIIICKNNLELKEAIKSIRENGCVKIQIQEFLQKEKELLICGCATSNGKIIIPGVVDKFHQCPYPTGAAGIATIYPIEKDKYIDINAVKAFISSIQFVGLFSMEFIVCNGKTYFLEINLRNDGHGYAPTCCGVNLPYIWVKNELDDADINEAISFQSKKNYQIEMVDFGYNILVRGGIFNWIRTFFSVKFHLYFSYKILSHLCVFSAIYFFENFFISTIINKDVQNEI